MRKPVSPLAQFAIQAAMREADALVQNALNLAAKNDGAEGAAYDPQKQEWVQGEAPPTAP